MRVILVRHASAEERDEARWLDADRPLSARGRKRFRAVARALGAAATEVDATLSSPYARAWETAQLLHAVAGWPEPRGCDALIESDPDAVGETVTQLGAGSVALVGHEPGMSALAAWLLGAPAAGLSFRKGGAASLDLDHWRAGNARLEWFAPPNLLRLMAAAGIQPRAAHIDATAQPPHAAPSTTTSPDPTSSA